MPKPKLDEVLQIYGFIKFSPQVDPLIPHASVVFRSIWRLYLNPLSSYEEFNRIVAEEIKVANREAAKRMDSLQQVLTKALIDQVRTEGNIQEADRLASSPVKWPQIKRGKTALKMDAQKFAFPHEAFDWCRDLCMSQVDSFGDLLSFYESVVLAKRETGESPTVIDPWRAAVLQAIETLRTKTVSLTPTLCGTVRAISAEYLEWLRCHPDVLDQIAWEAFEKILAEIFASRGFQVDITARVRNASADLIAVRTDEFGVQHRYLIECKRFNHSRAVGLDIVNAVLGASRRANVDHAFLVTTSHFTDDVLSLRETLRSLHLHLRDGKDVRKWLADYTFSEGGMWVAPGLDLS